MGQPPVGIEEVCALFVRRPPDRYHGCCIGIITGKETRKQIVMMEELTHNLNLMGKYCNIYSSYAPPDFQNNSQKNIKMLEEFSFKLLNLCLCIYDLILYCSIEILLRRNAFVFVRSHVLRSYLVFC